MNENKIDLDQISYAESDRLGYNVTLEDMLLDLKVLIKEYYCATFTDESKSLKIALNNGQKFLLNLKAV